MTASHVFNCKENIVQNRVVPNGFLQQCSFSTMVALKNSLREINGKCHVRLSHMFLPMKKRVVRNQKKSSERLEKGSSLQGTLLESLQRKQMNKSLYSPMVFLLKGL